MGRAPGGLLARTDAHPMGPGRAGVARPGLRGTDGLVASVTRGSEVRTCFQQLWAAPEQGVPTCSGVSQRHPAGLGAEWPQGARAPARPPGSSVREAQEETPPPPLKCACHAWSRARLINGQTRLTQCEAGPGSPRGQHWETRVPTPACGPAPHATGRPRQAAPEPALPRGALAGPRAEAPRPPRPARWWPSVLGSAPSPSPVTERTVLVVTGGKAGQHGSS